MSVFATEAITLPPRYSSTRPQPPPYKAASSITPLPPIYRSNTATRSASRSSSPSASISSISESPKYASIIAAPKPKPQLTATAPRVRNLPTWKDPYAETDAVDSIYQLQQQGSHQRAQDEEEEQEESSSWCFGCFWVGPSTAQPYISYYIF